MAKKKRVSTTGSTASFPDLTETEQDLLSQMEDGYQLETDSLKSDLTLRKLKDNEVIRPMSANRSTIEALEKRGLISPGKGTAPLTIVWQLSRKQKN
jgi:hypothetical protein